MADDPILTKEQKAAKWREDQEAYLAQRAEARRQEKETKRAQNQANWRALRESELAAQLAASGNRAAVRATERAARSQEWASRALPINDPFVIEMAARFHHTAVTAIPGYKPGDTGCTPQEFVDWQQRQRELMAKPQTQEEIDEVMRRAL